jgi:hypothetical protein
MDVEVAEVAEVASGVWRARAKHVGWVRRAPLQAPAALRADVVVPGHGPAFRATPAQAVAAALAA